MTSFELLVPTSILLAGVIDDLRSRKVHNWLVLSAAMVALTFQIYSGGWSTLQWGLLGLVTAFFIYLPLVLTKMVGAGDMKLLMAFGLATNIASVIGVTIFSLVWGALLGLAQSIMKGEGKSLFMNMIKIVRMEKIKATEYHRIPYTVALFFGWLTHLTLIQTEFSLW